MITAIGELSRIKALDAKPGSEETSAPGFGSFERILRASLGNIRQTEQDKAEAEYLLATGQLDNPAALMIATSKYEIAVDMMIQMRNRALEAYSELTRINL